MSTCQSCGASVFFAVYEKTGRTMIVDAKPSQRLVVVAGDPDDPLNPCTIRLAMRKTYVDHHATCPQAAEWRGKRAEEQPS